MPLSPVHRTGNACQTESPSSSRVHRLSATLRTAVVVTAWLCSGVHGIPLISGPESTGLAVILADEQPVSNVDPDASASESSAGGGKIDFASAVRPILEKHCWSCHGTEKRESGLRLDGREAMLSGGDGGLVVRPGSAGESRLIEYVSTNDPEKMMPPEGDRLSPDEVTILRAWIDQGCVWPESENVAEQKIRHWAYEPIQRSVVPDVRQTEWVRNPIDQFVLAELEKLSITPSPEADRYTLIRRLSLDLTGLLPTIEEVDAFVKDERPNAWELLVEKYLASPHYGERWGRHWLDMARYADSDGFEKDNPRPDAFLWRDWVINAINADMPFDQFTIEQLAGDLLPGATLQQKLATAFHRQTLTNTEGGTDKEQWRVEACFDRTETTGAVWMGLTIGCARCHTHKYDAITQREYYQLFAVYNNGDEQTFIMPKSDEEIAAYAAARPVWEASLADLSGQLKAAQEKLTAEFDAWEMKARNDALASLAGQAVPPADPPIPDNIRRILQIPPAERSDTQRQQLQEHFSSLQPSTAELLKAVQELKKKEPVKPEWTVRNIAQRVQEPRTTFVFRRGEFLEPVKDAAVNPGGISTLPPLRSRENGTPADRLDLARWLVSPDHPLTPRVTVNHVWRLLFGAGLVRTPNDFGVRGEKPTHPALLDWLASEFMGQRSPTDDVHIVIPWSRKSLIRMIVTSSTYRQSSRHRSELRDSDPNNVWLARQNRLRVEGEIVRDLCLNAAGLLSKKIGGPSVYPPLPPGIAELSYANNFKWQVSEGPDRYRRGMYTFFKRTAPHPNLTMFDCPDANLTCVERRTSNTPLQALTVLNNETFAEAAKSFAAGMHAKSDRSDEDRLTEAFHICLARQPSPEERQSLQKLLDDARVWYRDHAEDATKLTEQISSGAAPASRHEQAAWIAVTRVLLNLDEFITRE